MSMAIIASNVFLIIPNALFFFSLINKLDLWDIWCKIDILFFNCSFHYNSTCQTFSTTSKVFPMTLQKLSNPNNKYLEWNFETFKSTINPVNGNLETFESNLKNIIRLYYQSRDFNPMKQQIYDWQWTGLQSTISTLNI